MSARVTLGEHFRRLMDFNGREDRASFWPYAALSLVIIMMVGMIIFIPTVLSAIHEMQQFAIHHPDQVTVSSGWGHYSITVRGKHPEFFSKQSLVLYLAVTFGLAILLYSAAVVRRLRDRGKSGLWGLMPLPFILYSSIRMANMFSSAGQTTPPDMSLVFLIFFSNLLYTITMIVLIVMLAGPSKVGSES